MFVNVHSGHSCTAHIVGYLDSASIPVFKSTDVQFVPLLCFDAVAKHLELLHMAEPFTHVQDRTGDALKPSQDRLLAGETLLLTYYHHGNTAIAVSLLDWTGCCRQPSTSVDCFH